MKPNLEYGLGMRKWFWEEALPLNMSVSFELLFYKRDNLFDIHFKKFLKFTATILHV